MKLRASRIVILMALFAGVLAVYAAALYKMQIYDVASGNVADTRPTTITTRTETIRAARGDILDRNGVPLVSSRPTFDILLTRRPLLEAEDTNGAILDLAHTAIASGVAYNDAFPVNLGAPFEFRYDMTTQQRSRLDAYIDYFSELKEDITAEDLIVWMKKHYDIPYTTNIADARLIIGIRYELEIRAIVTNMAPYIFASDVPADFVAYVSEKAEPGITVQISSARMYHTSSAAHLLGYLSRMDEADYEKYGPLGYPMDAMIGKSGVEASFEQYLHGIDGTKVVELSADGTVLNERITQEAMPGSNVYLSIDLQLQETTEAALAEKIRTINLTRDEEQLITDGAVVVMQVKTGEALAIASYPPIEESVFNYALQGIYNPGSTFKPVTALAGLRAGVIERYTPVEDHGIFTKYPDFQPRCWLYTATGATHGALDVVGALRDSCNYFFYKIAADMGPSRIAQAAYDFGFGAKALTGVDIYENEGIVATEEYKNEVLGQIWFGGDTLLVAIGQGENRFTPIQLANYTATIANGGTLRDVSLLRAVKSSDYTGIVYEYEPTTRNIIPETDYIGYLQEGMREVARRGTARDMFSTYPIAVAAKTGTVQTGGTNINDGVFICYAPADDPEIAIAVVVKKGGSGAGVMEIAKVVFDEYFKGSSYGGIVVEGELLK